jgi:hypothetical protein
MPGEKCGKMEDGRGRTIDICFFSALRFRITSKKEQLCFSLPPPSLSLNPMLSALVSSLSLVSPVVGRIADTYKMQLRAAGDTAGGLFL